MDHGYMPIFHPLMPPLTVTIDVCHITLELRLHVLQDEVFFRWRTCGNKVSGHAVYHLWTYRHINKTFFTCASGLHKIVANVVKISRGLAQTCSVPLAVTLKHQFCRIIYSVRHQIKRPLKWYESILLQNARKKLTCVHLQLIYSKYYWSLKSSPFSNSAQSYGQFV